MKLKIGVGVLILAGIGLSVYFFHARLTADFLPPDRSFVGPNLVASVVQWALVFLVASLLYPPLRKAIDNWLKTRLHEGHAKLHAELAELKQKHEAAAKHRNEMDKKLDQLHEHLGVGKTAPVKKAVRKRAAPKEPK